MEFEYLYPDYRNLSSVARKLPYMESSYVKNFDHNSKPDHCPPGESIIDFTPDLVCEQVVDENFGLATRSSIAMGFKIKADDGRSSYQCDSDATKLCKSFMPVRVDTGYPYQQRGPDYYTDPVYHDTNCLSSYQQMTNGMSSMGNEVTMLSNAQWLPQPMPPHGESRLEVTECLFDATYESEASKGDEDVAGSLGKLFMEEYSNITHDIDTQTIDDNNGYAIQDINSNLLPDISSNLIEDFNGNTIQDIDSNALDINGDTLASEWDPSLTVTAPPDGFAVSASRKRSGVDFDQCVISERVPEILQPIPPDPKLPRLEICDIIQSSGIKNNSQCFTNGDYWDLENVEMKYLSVKGFSTDNCFNEFQDGFFDLDDLFNEPINLTDWEIDKC